MDSSLQKVIRLVGALESLLDQTSGAINSGDYTGVIDLQRRCQPVIDELSRLMVEPGLGRSLDDATRARVNRLLTSQSAQLEHIEADKSAVREELQIIRTAQARTHRFRSAYGRQGATSPPANYTETG